jgi:lycopene beta-cyclase
VDTDVAVVGNGPAGLAAAAACAERGLRVTVVAADHDAGWPATYGIWADELADGEVLAHRWEHVVVATGAGPVRRLHRPYGRIDNERLRGRLLERAAGARLVTGRAVAYRDGVVLDDGREVPARAVVDASGHRPALVRPGAGRAPAVQAAYGVVGAFSAGTPPLEPGGMVFMDFRDEPLRGLPGVAEDPTFLYGMDLGDGRWFVEETSLARRPPLGLDVLRTRLHARLRATGARLDRTLAVEHVAIPMGGPLPPRDQPVIAFGGAAAMVHPATGYQVGTALTRAPALAAALAGALSTPGADAAKAGWDAVWPADLVRQRAMHAFGLEALLRMDTHTTQRFFDAFFGLDEPRVRGYLSGAPSVHALAGTMLELFRHAPGALRRRLVLPALGIDGLTLLRGLTGRG